MGPSTPHLPVTFRVALQERFSTGSSSLNEAARQLLQASGKGLRPLCVQLVGEVFGCADLRHQQLGEAIEFLHVGSLIHDDILDEAELRRGVPAVHVRWGSKVAVLAGDYLLAQASLMVAGLDSVLLTRRLAEVISDLCEGELLQDEQLRQLDIPFEAYELRVAKKTASPFELAAEGAAILSSGEPMQVMAARRFGFHLGRLFQFVDDWLDWNATEEALQKPVGQDLLAGSLTLPVLVALRSPEWGQRLRDRLTPFPTAIDQDIRDIVLHPSLRQETARLVRQEGEQARDWLHQLPACDARDRLGAMLDQLLARIGPKA